MKKQSSFLFLLFSLTLLPVIAWAQIDLTSTGHVTLNNNLTVDGFSAIGTSPNYQYKLRVIMSGTAGSLYGIRSESSGGSGTIVNYGLYGRATSSGYTNYGVYGYASGGANNWAGYFNGSVYTTGSYQSSDQRFKKNITPVNTGDILSKIGQLEPVRYQFLSEPELRENRLPAIKTRVGNHIGLIAQNVEQIFPEFVIDVAQPLENEQGEIGENPEIVVTKAINYQELTVALLAAVQKQQAELETLKAEVEELKTQLEER